MSVVIIGFDPGDSCGAAWLLDKHLLHAFQGNPGDALALVELWLKRCTPEDDVTIACERYVSMRRTVTNQPTAQRVGGALESLAGRYAHRYVEQGPADAWAAAPNELLRRLGWYQTTTRVGHHETAKPHDADDANMAIRHGLLYMLKHHASTFDALLRGCGWVPT